MAIFQPVDMMGPAHRGNTIQQIAQATAKNVIRRQKMRMLLHNGAAAAGRAGAGASMGASVPMRGSFHPRATGVRGSVFRPSGNVAGGGALAGLAAQLGAQAASQQQFAYPDPGQADLPSLPDPNDPSQSAGATAPGQVQDPFAPGGPLAPGSEYNPTDPSGNPSLTLQTPGTDSTAPVYTQNPSYDPLGMGDENNNNWIPLGNGMFYNPHLDAVRGMPSNPNAGLTGIDKKF